MSEYRNIDFAEAYARHNGFRSVKNAEDSIVPMLPFFLWDCAYQYFKKHLQKANLSHIPAQCRNRWLEAYNRVNGRLFRSLDDGMTDAMIDLMDEYETAMAHHLEIEWYSADNLYNNGTTDEQREIMTATLLVNNLCLKAATVYLRVFTLMSMDQDVAAMLVKSRNLGRAYVKDNGIPTECTEYAYKQFTLSASILSNKTVEWAQNKNRK